MSVQPALEPLCERREDLPQIETVIDARPRDLGGLSIRRVLPSVARRMVGPFVFFDHMGPVAMSPGSGFDVRPHPHIGLATVTYLFEGEIVHRDSLGSQQPIRPGAINWMTAGRGIVHSERSGPQERAAGPRMHGIQLWVALPDEHEETEPAFYHHPGDTLPEVQHDGVRVRVLIGSAFGVTSPVHTFSPTLYAEAHMQAGGRLTLLAEHEERAIYVAQGEVGCGPQTAGTGRMVVLSRGAEPTLHALQDARVMLLAGAPLQSPRHIWWNFVSSSKERIEQAKQDWQQGRFPKVPGDEAELIPLPA